MKSWINEQIEGYEEIKNDITILRKHSVSPAGERGQVTEMINRYHPSQVRLKISSIIRETDSTSTLRLVAESGYLPPFQAGQYVNLFVEVNGVRTSRPYSISSPPNQTAYWDLTVRGLEEGFVSDHLLSGLKVGDLVVTTSPSGNFYYNPLIHGKNLVFIAGGSGITPFMSMIREVTDRGLERELQLIYGNRKETDIIFRDELEQRMSRFSNFKVHYVVSEPGIDYHGYKGFISADVIREIVGETGDKMFYVCGPEAMYSFVLRELESMGIPKRKTRVEVFGPPARIEQQPGWPESVDPNDRFKVRFKDGREVDVVAGEPLMNSLERMGTSLPANCRSGECSLCRTKLLSGKVFQPSTVKMRKSDLKYNYIHPCMAYPLEDLELMI